jgi:hypothetical protein
VTIFPTFCPTFAENIPKFINLVSWNSQYTFLLREMPKFRPP